MFIALSGVDCCGKSTQIEALERTLAERGLTTTRMWYRPGYSKLLDAARAGVRRVRRGALPTADSEAGRQARQQTFSKPGVARTWASVALVDMATQYGLVLRALQRRVDVVLCDRYVDDAMIDLSLRFPELDVERWPLTRTVLAGCPTPAASLLLMLDFDEQSRRMEIKQEPFPEADEPRRRRLARYQQLADSGRHTVIDASQDIDTVHRAVLERVGDALGTRLQAAR